MEENTIYEKANEYIQKINDKWLEIQKLGYLCYESDVELASEILWKLFEKDCFEEIPTYCRTYKKENGYTFKVLSEIEENLYFQFDIDTRYGIDIPQRVSNGKFRTLKEIPQNWQSIYEILEEIENEE